MMCASFLYFHSLDTGFSINGRNRCITIIYRWIMADNRLITLTNTSINDKRAPLLFRYQLVKIKCVVELPARMEKIDFFFLFLDQDNLGNAHIWPEVTSELFYP